MPPSPSALLRRRASAAVIAATATSVAYPTSLCCARVKDEDAQFRRPSYDRPGFAMDIQLAVSPLIARWSGFIVLITRAASVPAEAWQADQCLVSSECRNVILSDRSQPGLGSDTAGWCGQHASA